MGFDQAPANSSNVIPPTLGQFLPRHGVAFMLPSDDHKFSPAASACPSKLPSKGSWAEAGKSTTRCTVVFEDCPHLPVHGWVKKTVTGNSSHPVPGKLRDLSTTLPMCLAWLETLDLFYRALDEKPGSKIQTVPRLPVTFPTSWWKNPAFLLGILALRVCPFTTRKIFSC